MSLNRALIHSALACTFGAYFYQWAFGDANYMVAFERTYFQLLALGIVKLYTVLSA